MPAEDGSAAPEVAASGEIGCAATGLTSEVSPVAESLLLVLSL